MLQPVENKRMSATSDNECDIDVEKLLFEVRKRPCLYDTGSAEFHNSNMRENAWNGIGNILGTSGKDTFFFSIYSNPFIA